MRGPFPSLTAAKEAIEGAREEGPVESPLAGRIESPKQAAPVPCEDEQGQGVGEAQIQTETEPAPPPVEPTPPPEPKRTTTSARATGARRTN